jgi:hypothetical protein
MRKTILVLGAVMAVLMFAMVGPASERGLSPHPATATTKPQTKAECNNGGYAKYGFKNRGQCIKAVNHAPPADTTAPEITVTGPEGTTMRNQATYTMSANEPVTWECTATFPVELPPDVVYEPCTGGSYTYFTEWDGTYVFTFKATDAAGNTTTVTKTLVRDTPYVEILNPPGRDYPVISGDSYSFQFETSGPVDQVQCRLWANARSADPLLYEDWQDCTSPKTYTNLPDGAYRFEVAATAFATTDHGEWSMIDQTTFTVDTTPL